MATYSITSKNYGILVQSSTGEETRFMTSSHIYIKSTVLDQSVQSISIYSQQNKMLQMAPSEIIVINGVAATSSVTALTDQLATLFLK